MILSARQRWGAVIAFVSSAVFMGLFIFTEQIKQHPIIIQEKVISETLSADIEAMLPVPTTSIGVNLLKRVNIEISYISPIRVNQSLEVRATLRQMNLVFGSVGNTDPPPSQEALRLTQPLVLRLSSPAFTLASEDARKAFSQGTPLPARTAWVPIANRPGSWRLLITVDFEDGGSSAALSAQEQIIVVNMRNARTVINFGEPIVLPIEVYVEQGIPAHIFEIATLLGSFIAFVVGSSIVTGALSKFWFWLRRR